MRIINENNLKILIADEGKQIRSKDDVYRIEDGQEIFPYYTKKIYLAKNFDENTINDLYVEETVAEYEAE